MDKRVAAMNAEVDSVQAVHERDKAIKDEIRVTQQDTAFGRLLFGTDRKAAYAMKVELAGETGFIDIGRCSYYFKMLFNEEYSLYRVELSGLTEHANHIDGKVLDCTRNLANAIERKYGPADTKNSEPKFFDYKPGKMQVMYVWDIGTKHIQVGIHEKSSGSEYSAEAWIWDTPMQEAVWKSNDAATSAEQSDASKKF